MNAVIVYREPGLTLYCADARRAYHPYPAQDDMLEHCKEGGFVLRVPLRQKAVFQLIVASEEDTVFTDVAAEGMEMTCLSVEGFDAQGNPMRREMPVEAGKPWPMWCIVSGTFIGRQAVTICCREENGREICFSMEIEGYETSRRFEDDREELARLNWLNSREGTEDVPTAPYTPVTRDGLRLGVLGRDILLRADGFISSIQTHYVGNNSKIVAQGQEILAAPLAIEILEDGAPVRLSTRHLEFTDERETAVSWRGLSEGNGYTVRVEGKLEFDGTLYLYADVSSNTPRRASVRLVHRPVPSFAKYFMGLGVEGGAMPETHVWKWDAERHQDAYWAGSMNGGLFVRPRDLVKPVPFVNIYYHHGERNLPAGWVNGGAGGFRLNARDSIELAFESGELELDAFPRTFGAELMISPFRPTEPQKQWHTRYYHGDAYAVDQKLWVQEAMKNGCTHIIEHHASDSYPFINYPMYTPEMNRPLIEEAHAAGIGVKFYYTVRELTSRLPEFWALRSLRDEILPRPLYDQGGVPGQGGTDPDLIEIGGKELIPAWKHIFDRGLYKGMTDPAIITNATSRLCNFHVEGLKWMLKNLKIDGIYIDDVGYKREVMRRVRRTLDQYRPGALIDMHTWNHFEDKLGAGYGHNMLIYMELMPYLDSLLIGEAYDYDHVSPEYFMTEISGLPFGLMGETLQNGGNQWRGMLYGMDCRYPWCSGVHSPVPLWQLWDAFDMDRSEMIGYWEDGQPVYADQEDVKCTVYVHREHGRLLCCFANFSGRETTFTPVGSGLEGKALRLPGIGEMQGERPLQAGEPLTVTANGGVILWAE